METQHQTIPTTNQPRINSNGSPHHAHSSNHLQMMSIALIVALMIMVVVGLFLVSQQNNALRQRVAELENQVSAQDHHTGSEPADDDELVSSIDEDMMVIKEYYLTSYPDLVIDVQYVDSHVDNYAVLPIVAADSPASFVTQVLEMDVVNGERVVSEIIFDRNDQISCREIDNTGLHDVFGTCLLEDGQTTRETRP